MFRPNLSCVVYTNLSNDIYGKPSLSGAVNERCAIVSKTLSSVKSTLRADTSASRGNAREAHADVHILLTANTKAKINDVIEVSGTKIQVTKMEERRSLLGRVDHYEAIGIYWSSQ